MRIAMIAPLWERVPPITYGGTEQVIHLITEELVRQGHDVTLFASGNSVTEANLVSTIPKSFREYFDISKLVPTSNEVTMHQVLLLGQALKDAGGFDIVHNHTAFQMLPFAEAFPVPVITTLHGTFEPETLKTLFLEYKHLPYVSISNRQRMHCPELNYVANIYHGLNTQNFSQSFSTSDKKYLAFLGRFSPEKGPLLAIRAAKDSGWPLILAGKINSWEQDYYDQEIAPELDGRDYKMIGEVNFKEKVELLRNAAGTLFPIEWEEPFGLVMIESMACGTPVIALNNGSVPEVITHCQTGYIANNYGELVDGINHLKHLDRENVYQQFLKRFTVEKMTSEYLELYHKLIEEHKSSKAMIETL